MGYSTYLTFLLGYISTLITVYYLAIKSVPSLLNIFPRFVPFAEVATVIGVPLSVGIGWMHLKRTPAYSSEQDIAVESNPYNYKITPGTMQEAFTPASLETMKMLRRLLESQGLLSQEDESRVTEIERRLKVLIDGGSVGTPRRK
jgi:hypothetical protein